MEDSGNQGFLKGQFLMAMPGLLDPNFHQTVTCMCEHNAEGAMGVVINRIHQDLTEKDIFEELSINCSPRAERIPIHLGGPVHIAEIFVLHGPPFDWEASLMITPGVALSNTKDIIESIAKGNGPESFIISIGCAGWGPGQLEAEIKQNAWLTAPVFEENIFKMPVENRWEEAVKKVGIDPRLLSDRAGHA
ncbi:MAG: YqgE/AlgH family protein [Deltaproteobacteria bacterium]|jgi:putative transcriptional regulator|nr:YqgE/AlgH family protein [Deltaproteobacteria bacterium]